MADEAKAWQVQSIDEVLKALDTALTAQAIAKRLSLGLNTVTGRQVDALSDTELLKRAPEIDIVARATPLAKQRVLKALQGRGTSWR